MAKVKTTNVIQPAKRRPALTPEARENQLIALAVDLVEQRLLDGTASSQETTHFLKLGSTKHRLEMERLKAENQLINAKAEEINTRKESKALYENAIKAFRNYAGYGNIEDEFDD